MMVADVPDIVWLPPDREIPRLKWVEGLPENAADVVAAWELRYEGGPLHDQTIVNDDPVPEYLVYVDDKKRDRWASQVNTDLVDIDPCRYIAKLPQRRHIYGLTVGEDAGQASYSYLGWWSPL